VEGQQVVSSIEQNDVMEKVTILRQGKEAKEFDASNKNFEKLIAEGTEKLKAAKAAAEEAMKASQVELTDMAAWVKKNYPKAQKTASGLYYIVEKEGDGKQAVAGKLVKVHYTGKLITGQKFDSSYDRNEPIAFPLGQGRVIPGWDEGVAMMKEGGKMKLIIPYNLGYGEKGFGNVIPPKAPLIFDTELISVEDNVNPGR
jgi:peptidylprolyl isomerase